MSENKIEMTIGIEALQQVIQEAVNLALQNHQKNPAAVVAEYICLPRAGAGYRDPVAGRSRSWLVETNQNLPTSERFLFRVIQDGNKRGAVFINVRKLRDFLKRSEAEDLAHE